jgi:hypothetical protein
MDTTTTWILIVSFGGTILAFNAVLLGIIVFVNRKASAARGWPSTAGTVLTSTLESRRASDGAGHVNYPVVAYSYEVKGERYEGRRITPGLEWGGTGAEQVIARYPVGSRVSVYYDPGNPSEALLERKAPAYRIWLWVALIALDIFLCGIGGVLYWAFTQ